MNIPKDLIKISGNLSRIVLGWLRDKKLPADPVCYHVAYNFFHKPDAELKKRVEQLNGKPSEVFDGIHQIYQDFVLDQNESNLKQFSAKISKLANETSSSVNTTKNHLHAYSKTLIKTQKLLSAPSEDACINVVTLLIDETSQVHEHAEYLESKLKKVNEQMEALQKEHLEFKNKLTLDPLTQILNRDGLQEELDKLILDESSFPVSVLLADIDNFKKFNDEYGHLVGDKVLKLVAATLKKHTKHKDVLARFGGEEFLVLLHSTAISDASSVAETLRKSIESLRVKKRNSEEYLDKLTISAGLAEFLPGQEFNDALDRADKQLYRSKSNGKNCVNRE